MDTYKVLFYIALIIIGLMFICIYAVKAKYSSSGSQSNKTNKCPLDVFSGTYKADDGTEMKISSNYYLNLPSQSKFDLPLMKADTNLIYQDQLFNPTLQYTFDYSDGKYKVVKITLNPNTGQVDQTSVLNLTRI
jgi:hypothetical protein